MKFTTTQQVDVPAVQFDAQLPARLLEMLKVPSHARITADGQLSYFYEAHGHQSYIAEERVREATPLDRAVLLVVEAFKEQARRMHGSPIYFTDERTR